MLTGVADALIAAAKLEPALAGEILAALGDQYEAACSALPELTEIFGSVAEDILGPEKFGEGRSVQAAPACFSMRSARQAAPPWCCSTIASGPTS